MHFKVQLNINQTENKMYGITEIESFSVNSLL